jgi:hypothetical protein
VTHDQQRKTNHPDYRLVAVGAADRGSSGAAVRPLEAVSVTYNTLIRAIANRAGEVSAMPDDILRQPMLSHASFPVDLSGTREEAIAKRLAAQFCLADDYELPVNPYFQE